jgi:hypothetical protein
MIDDNPGRTQIAVTGVPLAPAQCADERANEDDEARAERDLPG